jgi:hypothetical protein
MDAFFFLSNFLICEHAISFQDGNTGLALIPCQKGRKPVLYIIKQYNMEAENCAF